MTISKTNLRRYILSWWIWYNIILFYFIWYDYLETIIYSVLLNMRCAMRYWISQVCVAVCYPFHIMSFLSIQISLCKSSYHNVLYRRIYRQGRGRAIWWTGETATEQQRDSQMHLRWVQLCLIYPVLNCTELHCTVLYCSYLSFTLLLFIELYCTVPFCAVSRFALHNIMHCTALHCTELGRAELSWSVLHCSTVLD